MQEGNRFYTPGVIIGTAFFLFILGQVIMRNTDSYGPLLLLSMIATIISPLICFVGIIFLAFALGKPVNKSDSVSLTKLIYDIREPGKITIPFLETTSESDTQSYGLLLIILSFVIAIAAFLLALVSIFSSLGSGLGFSGGTCDSFCEGSWNSAYYACMTSIAILVGGLFVTARPWVWFGGQTKLVLETTNVSTESTESNQEDFSSLTVLELKVKLKERGLPVSGKKTDLIARLNTKEEVQEVEKYIHNCHNCKQKLKIPVGYEGQIKCPSCATRISV